MSLNPLLQPFPGACANTILTTDCAAVMSVLCATSNQQGLSKLLDGASNCLIWKNGLLSAHDADPANAKNMIEYLDLAIVNYCNGLDSNGFNSNECSCLNMPVVAKESCEAQLCGGDPEDCLGNHFLRPNQGMQTCNSGKCTNYTGSYVDISFPECIPQVCWNQQCWNQNTLLKTAQRDLQQNCVQGICVSIIGTENITTPVANPSAFEPASLLSNCGDGPVGGYPIYVPTTWTTPVDNAFVLPASIANGGNQGGLTLYYQSTTNFGGIDIGASVPDEIFIASNGKTVFNIEFDPVRLLSSWKQASNQDLTQNVTVKDIPECARTCTVPSNTIVSPVFFYTFYDGGKLEIFSFSLSLVLTPPAGIQPKLPMNPLVINKEISKTIYVISLIATFFLLLTWIFYVSATRRAQIVLKAILSQEA